MAPKSAEIFSVMKGAITQKGPELVKKIKGVIAWDIKDSGNGAGKWIIDLKKGNGAVHEGSGPKPDVTLTLKDDDMIAMAEGKLNANNAFFQGKLKIKGNMGLAMKLSSVMDAVKAYAANPPAAAAGSSCKSAEIFKLIDSQLGAQGATLVKKMKGIIKYVITDSGNGTGEWTLDLKNGSGKLYAKGDSGAPKPDMTLTISDDNMFALFKGKLNPQQAFMSGKLKIKGNMGLAMKMGNLTKQLQSKM
eukprot:g1112.t1